MLFPGSPPASTRLIAHPDGSFGRAACLLSLHYKCSDGVTELSDGANPQQQRYQALWSAPLAKHSPGKQQGITRASSAPCPKSDQLQSLSSYAVPSSEIITAWLWSGVSLSPWESGQREQNPATEETTKPHEPPRNSGHSQGPFNAFISSAVNRSISGCLQESEQIPGKDDVRAVENTGEKKSFCLQSTCELKIQNTHLSISIALQTAVQAIPPRVAIQNYFNRLSLVS